MSQLQLCDARDIYLSRAYENGTTKGFIGLNCISFVHVKSSCGKGNMKDVGKKRPWCGGCRSRRPEGTRGWCGGDASFPNLDFNGAVPGGVDPNRDMQRKKEKEKEKKRLTA